MHKSKRGDEFLTSVAAIKCHKLYVFENRVDANTERFERFFF